MGLLQAQLHTPEKRNNEHINIRKKRNIIYVIEVWVDMRIHFGPFSIRSTQFLLSCVFDQVEIKRTPDINKTINELKMFNELELI